MSRCFPFPPPGYEKKGGIDGTDLLTKEKHREKKQKKDKDKEKKEGKEKRDKERSKEKHKEKKERKEKHKDNDRDKEKNQTSDDKRVEGWSQFHDGETRVPSSLPNNEVKDSKFVQELVRRIRDEDGATGNHIVQKNADTNDRGAKLPGRAVEKIIGEQSKESAKANNKNEEYRKVNGQRNYVAGRGLDNASVQEFFGMDQKRVEGIAQPVENKDVGKQMEGKEKNKHKGNDREKKSKSKDKDRGIDKKRKEKTKEMIKSNNEQPEVKEGIPRFIETSKEFLGNSNSRPSDLAKSSSKSSTDEGTLGKRKEPEMNGFLRDNGIRPKKSPRPVASFHPVLENGRKLESNQNSIESASGLQKAANNNHKADAKNHRINGLMEAQQANVLPKRSLSAAVQVQNSIEPVSGLQGAANNVKIDTKNRRINGSKEAQQPNVLPKRPFPAVVQVQNSIDSMSGLQGASKNHKVDKKGHRINGLTEAQQPNVLSKRSLAAAVQVHNSTQSASGLQGAANNQKFDTKRHGINDLKEVQQPNLLSKRPLPAAVPVHNSIVSESGLQAAADNQKVDTKGHRINGFMEAQEPNMLSEGSLPAAIQVKENGEAPANPPHPDSKFLNQLLSVPKVEQWSDCNDQEWLFGSNYVQSKKAKVNSSGVEETPQVWDQALKIESADVLALPYVIPY